MVRGTQKLHQSRSLSQQEQIMGEWTFFSNHGHVLVCLARDSEARLRDVAVQVGITERAVQKIVRDMQDAGYLEVTKHGRRNRYRINNRKALRHPLQSGCTVGQLLQLLARQAEAKTKTAASPKPAKPTATEPIAKETAPVPPVEASQAEPARIEKTAKDSVTKDSPEKDSLRQDQEPAEKPRKETQEESRKELEQGRLF